MPVLAGRLVNFATNGIEFSADSASEKIEESASVQTDSKLNVSENIDRPAFLRRNSKAILEMPRQLRETDYQFFIVHYT